MSDGEYGGGSGLRRRKKPSGGAGDLISTGEWRRAAAVNAATPHTARIRVPCAARVAWRSGCRESGLRWFKAWFRVFSPDFV